MSDGVVDRLLEDQQQVPAHVHAETDMAAVRVGRVERQRRCRAR